MRVLSLCVAIIVAAIHPTLAQTTLRVGDQKSNSQAVMEAAGVLKDLPYKIEWKEFPAAAPLLEALSAGAIETGLVGRCAIHVCGGHRTPLFGASGHSDSAVRGHQVAFCVLARTWLSARYW
jgi:sulfonate transport system substrate-binding protein